MSVLRPEFRIAMALATLKEDVFEGVERREIDDLDWKLLVDTCGRHKLIRPLMDVTPQLDCEVPTWVRPSLWTRLRRNEQKSNRHTAQLCRVTEFLGEHDFDFRIMRGPVLSVLAYDDPDKREISDLDIVVAQRDVGRARKLLNGKGFRSGESQFIVEQNCAYQLYNGRLQVGLDLHWSAVPAWLPVGTAFDAMSRSPAWVTIDGKRIPTFDREETLVIQCVQCMKTAWVELDRWLDFAMLCAKWNDLDWERVIGICRRHGYLRSLALTLHLLGAPVRNSLPATVVAQLESDTELEQAEQLVLARLPEEKEKDRFRGRSDKMMALSREYLPYWVYKVFSMSSIHYPIATWWLVTDSAQQRRGYAWWIIRSHFSPKQADYDAVDLPRQLHGLYYLVRPARLAWRELRARGSGSSGE